VSTAYSVANQLANIKRWDSFTAGYDSANKAAMKARIDVIDRSRDPFSKSRNWNFFSSYIPVLGLAKFRLEKRGETRLVEVTTTGNGKGAQTNPQTRYEWKAKDSLSLQFKYFKVKRGVPRWVRVETPIGWGQALANNESGDASIEPCKDYASVKGFAGVPVCPRWLGNNSAAELLADNNVLGLNGEQSREKMAATFNGIQAYRSLSEQIEHDRDPKLVLRVEVAMPIQHVRSSEKFISGATLNAPLHAPGATLSSVSTAEVYYQRPEDVLSVQGERANGYNPYWDVRLAATSNKERLIAFGLRNAASTNSAPSSVSGTLNSYVGPTASSAQQQLSSLKARMAILNSSSAEYSLLQARHTQLQAALNTGVSTAKGSDQNIIAAAMGVNANSIQQATAGATADLDSYVNSKLAAYDFNTLQTQVEGELSDALEDAAKTILSGAAKGALGDSRGSITNAKQTVAAINGKAQSIQDSLIQPINTFNSVKGSVEGKVSQLNAELDSVKGKLVAEFTTGKKKLEQDLIDAKKPILKEIKRLEREIVKDVDPPLSNKQIARINKQIEAAKVQLSGVEESHRKLAAKEVMEVVNRSTTLMKIDLDQAERLIQLDNGEFQFDIENLKYSSNDVGDD